MRSIAVSSAELRSQRHAAADADVHFCESLAEAIILEFSRPDDLVLDPFAGYGTTLVVAERLSRRGLGIEILEDRAELTRAKVGSGGVVIVGDARSAVRQVRREVALCFTSPPYMTRERHPQNPLTGYRTLDGQYERYLAQLGAVFRDVASLLAPGGHLVINAADPLGAHTVTHLVDDLRDAVAPHLTWKQDIEVAWDDPPSGLAGDTCLVFEKDAQWPLGVGARSGRV